MIRTLRSFWSAPAVLLLLLLVVPAGTRAQDDRTDEHVILVHGFGRSATSMTPLQDSLEEAGYRVHSVSYPSTSEKPKDLVSILSAFVAGCEQHQPEQIHYVAHSLGGLLVRAHLANDRPERLGRVVLLATPNHGSELVDPVAQNKLFEKLFGPTAAGLGTGEDGFAKDLPAPDFELGIIAGSRSLNPVGSAMLPGPDDGAVSTASARLPGATDFLIVKTDHMSIKRNKQVARQVGVFLENGHFDHPEESARP
jgi:triacylglycerol lipase